MPGYNFTDHVRQALLAARQEAARLQHGYVGTEHILLGLLRVPDSTAAAILSTLSIGLPQIRAAVVALLSPAAPHDIPGPDLPYTSRGKKALEEAMIAARDLGHSNVGTEHLLLGLFREGKGIASQALTQTGLTLEQLAGEAGRDLNTPERQGVPAALMDATRWKVHADRSSPKAARWALGIAVVALVVALVALVVAL